MCFLFFWLFCIFKVSVWFRVWGLVSLFCVCVCVFFMFGFVCFLVFCLSVQV